MSSPLEASYPGIHTPPVVSQEDWEAARQQMLVKEKAFTRARDALAAERRRMPWMAVEKAYEFEGADGKLTLLDMFEGRRQLIVCRAFSSRACTAGPTTPARAARSARIRWDASNTSARETPRWPMSAARRRPTSPA
jgi:predicted dithiol-disulfide oxidoreductase (DUF899 family)